MYNLNLFSQHYIPEYRKEAEHSRERGGTVDDQERDVIDFQAVREVAYACSSLISVRYDYNFMSAVYKLGGQLVDM